MDSEPNSCWRCGEPARGMCPECEVALYCSTTCLRDDRATHLSECAEAGTAERPCANCGLQSRHLSRCARCHLAGYCSSECGELHSRLHLPACLAGREAVLRLANRLTHEAEPFRLPVYFGDGVHALNLLKNTDQTGEEPCQLLQLSAQLPHLLRTVAAVSGSRRPLLATLASDSGHQLARAYLLLYLLARGAGPEASVQVLYSRRLSPEHARLLQAALEQLVTATYSQLLELVPWVRLGRAALSHWQEVWRAWLHAMQDAGCLARLDRCASAVMSQPETAARLQRYLDALPEKQQRSARDLLLGHGTLLGDRQRRAAADCANVTLLALHPREPRHREAFSDLRLGADPPDWPEAAGGADTVLAPPPVPAGPLADWDRAEIQRALGSDVDPAEGCRLLAEDCAEATEARAAAGRLSIRLVQFTSLTELNEQLADLQFERVFTADAGDRLGLFDVLELAEVLLAPVPHALIVSSHSRWATLTSPAGTALSGLQGGGSMAWDREMDTEKFRLQTYLQGERLAYAARARQKDVLDPQLRVPTVPEVTSFGTLLMTNYTRHLQSAVPYKFRPERRLVSNGDETMRFLEWRRDPEGVRKRLAGQHNWHVPSVTEEAAALARTGAVPSKSSRTPTHQGPGLYERHVQSPASDRDNTAVYGSIRRPAGSERRTPSKTRSDSTPEYTVALGPDREQDYGRQPAPNTRDEPDRHPSRTQSDRRARRVASAPLARAESLPAAQRLRPQSRGFQPSREAPLYENPAAARAAARKSAIEARETRDAERDAARDRAAQETRVKQPSVERPRSEQARPQRQITRRRTLEGGSGNRTAQQRDGSESRRSASLRVGKNRNPVERTRAPEIRGQSSVQRDGRAPTNRLSSPMPRSLDNMFPSLRSPPNPKSSVYSNASADDKPHAATRDAVNTAQREAIYDTPRETLRSVPPHQQSSVGRSGTPQFGLGPNGTPYAMQGGRDRPTSPGSESVSSQYDSTLSASEYSALQTPEGRRRLANIFTYPPVRSERPASVSSFPTTSTETADTPPSLPVKRHTGNRVGKAEQSPLSAPPLTLPRQSESRHPLPQSQQPRKGHPDAVLTLPRQASESSRTRQPARQSDRAKTLPSQMAPSSYSGAPIPLPRKKQSTGAFNSSEYDDYAVPRPNPRQFRETPPNQQSASASEETLVSSSGSDVRDEGNGPNTANITTEPQEAEASPTDIDRLTQWREPKSIGDWLKQDRTRQSEFESRVQPATGNNRWTRSELGTLPSTSPSPTRPGNITPTSSASAASAASASEKRRAFLRSRETTEEKLVRSLENAETAWWTKPSSSTDTTTSEDRSHHTTTSPVYQNPSKETMRSTSRGFTPNDRTLQLSTRAGMRQSEDTQSEVLSLADLPHGDNEPQTIAELGLRDTVATWIMEQCLQEVLSEERETLRVHLIEWLEQKIEDEMLSAKKALKEMKAASKAVQKGQASIDNVSRSGKDASVTKPSDTHMKKDEAKMGNLSVPKSPDAATPKLNQSKLTPFNVNSEETGKLGSPRFSPVDTPVPKSISREKFFADMFQFKSPETGERLVTLRFNATAESPPTPGEKNPSKTPLFSSSVTLSSQDRALSVPNRIVIDVVAEPQMVQPPAIRVPLQSMTETEVKKLRPSTPPVTQAGVHEVEDPASDGSRHSISTASSITSDTAVTAAVAASVVTSAVDKTAATNPPINRKADIKTPSDKQGRSPGQSARREAFKPLSLLAPDSTGRMAAVPSAHLHRSPVEEPYPVITDDLNGRRMRLEARAVARKQRAEQLRQSDSSPDQPQPLSNFSNLGTSDSAGEALPAVATSEEDRDDSDSKSSEKRRAEHDESDTDLHESEDESERANTADTYRSSVHIPMEQVHGDSADTPLQEILIKFPLVRLDGKDDQPCQPEVTANDPGREVKEAAPAILNLQPTSAGQEGRIYHSAEENRVDVPSDRKENTVNEGGEEGSESPSNEHRPLQTADDIQEDHSEPPPLPLSSPPKKSEQPKVEAGARHDGVAAEDDTQLTQPPPTTCVGATPATDSHTTRDGAQAAEGATVFPKSETLVAEGSPKKECAVPLPAETSSVPDSGKKTANPNQELAEELNEGTVSKPSAETQKDTEAATTGKETLPTPLANKSTAQSEGEGASTARRHSMEDKRLKHLVQRRRSRKMSMDKEYHDMKRKLTEANASLLHNHDAEEGHNRGPSANEVHDTGSVQETNGEASRREGESNESTAGRTSDRLGHPGSLGRCRRKSRPMSMDDEYYTMKNKLQIHNGHHGGHSTASESDISSKPTVEESTNQSEPMVSNLSHSPARAALRPRSNRLSMDKEFFEMRAQLALFPGGHSDIGSETGTPANSASGCEPEDPPSPPPSPAPGAPPAIPQPRRGSRSMSMQEEFFAIRAAHLARHPADQEQETGSASSSPKVQPRLLSEKDNVIVPKEEPQLRAVASSTASSNHPPSGTLPEVKEIPSSPPTRPVLVPTNATQTPASSLAHQPPPSARPDTAAQKPPSEPPPPTKPKPSPPPARSDTAAQKPPSVPPKTKPKPNPARPDDGPPARSDAGVQNRSPVPPPTRPKPSLLSQNNLKSGSCDAPVEARSGSGDRAGILPLSLDPELLATRVQSERAAVGSASPLVATSPATPPSSPTSVLSRNGVRGSIRRRAQELEHAAEESAHGAPEQPSEPAPFARAGSVRDRIRRLEMAQREQTESQAVGVKTSPGVFRRHSTHSPFTRLGSGGGGGISSMTVRLQPSPPGAAPRGARSPSGESPPTPLQRGTVQRRSLPATRTRAPVIPEIPARTFPCASKETSEKASETEGPEKLKSSAEVSPVQEVAEKPSLPEERAQEPAPQIAAPESSQQSQTTRTTSSATPSPPSLINWPWTADDDAAEASRNDDLAQQKSGSVSSAGSSPEHCKASQQSGRSSLSAYETANEMFSQPGSLVELEEAVAEEAPRAGERDPAAGTDIDTQDDEVFSDDVAFTSSSPTTMVTLL